MSKSKHINLFVICINICLNLLTIPHFISHFYSFFLVVKCLKNNLSNNKILKWIKPNKTQKNLPGCCYNIVDSMDFFRGKAEKSLRLLEVELSSGFVV